MSSCNHISDNGTLELYYSAIRLAVEDFNDMLAAKAIIIKNKVPTLNPDWKGKKTGCGIRNPYEITNLIDFLTKGAMDEWLDDLGGKIEGATIRKGLGIKAFTPEPVEAKPEEIIIETTALTSAFIQAGANAVNVPS